MIKIDQSDIDLKEQIEKTLSLADKILQGAFQKGKVEEAVIQESAASDAHERFVADTVMRKYKKLGLRAERPKVSTSYSDVLITTESGDRAWVEVKMNHTDNLANYRFFYRDGEWQTTYGGASAEVAAALNQNAEAKAFIKDLIKFTGIKNPYIPTNKAAIRDATDNTIDRNTMASFLQARGSQYIATEENVNLGRIVRIHYKDKAEPANYLQAGDDFYLLGKDVLGLSEINPLKIPLVTGKGSYKVRVSMRSEFYEIMFEIKIKDMPDSPYSLLRIDPSKIDPLEALVS